MTGRLIADRYQLIEPIASGGFGQVWKALDSELGIVVAFKRVRLPADAGDADRAKAADAARAEARHAAGLAFHPHIVAVTNVAVDADGMPWLAMRHIDGPSLATALESGPLPPDEVAHIAGALLDALDAAHRAGIVHRDVKPGNVMLDGHGGVFLTDFGIAKRQDGTVTDAFTGSVGYAAPERFHHKAFGPPNGPAGDLFSVGATLYHAVEGRAPFEPDPGDSSVGAVLHAVCYEPHPPMRRAEHLAPLIDALLAKKAADRPSIQAAQAMLAGGAAQPGEVPHAAVRSGEVPRAEPQPANVGPTPWQSTNTPADTAGSQAATVTASSALPKPMVATTEPAKAVGGGPSRLWFIVVPIVLAVIALVSLNMSAFTWANHEYDPQNGPSDNHHSATIYRLFEPGKMVFSRPDTFTLLILMASCLLTAAATASPRKSHLALRALRWCAYLAIPIAASAFVVLVNHRFHVTLLSHHTSDTYNDGSTYSSTTSLGAGMWLLYLAFIALYALFIWREALAVRQKRG